MDAHGGHDEPARSKGSIIRSRMRLWESSTSPSHAATFLLVSGACTTWRGRCGSDPDVPPLSRQKETAVGASRD